MITATTTTTTTATSGGRFALLVTLFRRLEPGVLVRCCVGRLALEETGTSFSPVRSTCLALAALAALVKPLVLGDSCLREEGHIESWVMVLLGQTIDGVRALWRYGQLLPVLVPRLGGFGLFGDGWVTQVGGT
ncbi:hypothetical protein KC316_g88 [Hortaea werneckii]|nr:hypothetical protein KC316_g88 [Hortaea werneckii]